MFLSGAGTVNGSRAPCGPGFPGLLKQRSFHIVVVGEGRGTGMALTQKPDQVVSYDGSQKVVKL
jgi:hypothetical protein